MRRQSPPKRVGIGVRLAILFSLPLVLLALIFVAVRLTSAVRYAEAYFTTAYQDRYDSPGAVARDLEIALRSGDQKLLAELHGLHNPPFIEANPDIILTILLEVDEQDYFHYLFFDTQTYRRSTYYLHEVSGRWVVVPEDLYFYLDSGRWRAVFMPLLAAYYALLIVVVFGLAVYQLAARVREERFDR